MKVIAKIQSTVTEDAPEVDMSYYKGESALDALHAVTTLLRDAEDHEYTRLLAINIEL